MYPPICLPSTAPPASHRLGGGYEGRTGGGQLEKLRISNALVYVARMMAIWTRHEARRSLLFACCAFDIARCLAAATDEISQTWCATLLGATNDVSHRLPVMIPRAFFRFSWTLADPWNYHSGTHLGRLSLCRAPDPRDLGTHQLNSILSECIGGTAARVFKSGGCDAHLIM